MDQGESSYRRFLAGDNEGLHEIVCAYRTGLMLYLHSIVRNIHTAEELTEDTFYELLRKRPRFSGKSSFKTWLYAIGHHVAAKYLRKHTKHSEVPLESQEYLADADDLDRSIIRSENPAYRQVLYLSYFEGFSNAEAAEILHKSERQIRDLLYHAKKALKTELERSGFEYED